MIRWRCGLCPENGTEATRVAARRALVEHETAAHPDLQLPLEFTASQPVAAGGGRPAR